MAAKLPVVNGAIRESVIEGAVPDRDEDFGERERDRRVLPIVSRQTSRAIPSAPRKEPLSTDVLALRTVLFERNAAGRNHGRGTGN